MVVCTSSADCVNSFPIIQIGSSEKGGGSVGTKVVGGVSSITCQICVINIQE